ncbi:acyl-CoA dehydrogenase [Catenulispora pinisilvae]|uniref:acyl-CoA dehydrogenase n=1 Tax=Catenulispora pinisilvae TaxID=2705253 RepID=UPI002B276D1F|nr:acyl-CoA dehydrogenase [Catenulispora pinisilvae]
MASVTAGIGSIGITSEHRDLAEAVRGWLARAVPPAAVRAALDAEQEERPAFWAELAKQGLLGNHLPEDVGGADAGLLTLAVALEETGRAATPGPFLPTAIASVFLADSGGKANADVLRGIADGSTTAAVATDPGTLVAEPVNGGYTLDGSVEPVIGAALADWLLLTARRSDGSDIQALVPAAELDISPLISLDRTRRVAKVGAEGVFVPRDRVIIGATDSLDRTAALLASAEAVGIADWCTRTAAEYAKVRVQFGKPIGQFQGVKHRCANMVARMEQARSAVWDAAFVAGSGIAAQDVEAAEPTELPIALAAALALEAAVECAKDCIQVLGGIGFTWEHDAHVYLRRALTLRQVHGSTSRRLARVAELTAAGRRRELKIELPAEADAYRTAAREAFAAVQDLTPAEQRKALAATGYAAPYLSKPYGLSAGPVEQIVIAQEQAAAKVKLPDLIIGNWVVPTLVKYGTDEQRERFAAPTLRGEVIWCQLFSEPGAGSDLAALTTRATRAEGGWRLDGQKVWTSVANFAQWAICIARTSPDKPKHEGITYFLVDMLSPGVDVRPLREITGQSMFNEVFLDGVFVPDALVVGEVDGGWPLARNTLGNERVSLASGPVLGGSLEGLLSSVAARDELDPVLAQRLGALVCQGQSAALLGLRTTLRQLSGMEQGPEASIRKLISMKLAQDVAELGLDLLGAAGATEAAGSAAGWTQAFLSSRCLTIAGGTTEVQLNVIGERILGLPRD